MVRAHTDSLIDELRSQALAGRVTRRQMLHRATALGLSAPVVAMLLTACGDDDEAAPTATTGTTAGAPTATRSTSPTGTTGAAASPTTGAASAASPTAVSTGKPAARNQVLTYSEANSPRSLDPANALESNSLHITRACYEGLVAHKTGTTEIIPRLAKEWTISDDASVYTFTLQDNVKFHDGTMMDAEAVKKSYDRVIQMNLGPASLLSAVQEVKVIDPKTVQIALKQSHAYFMTYVTKIGIISPSAVQQNDKGGDLAAAWLEAGNSAGTGPFRITEYRKSESTTLDRFSDYWRGWDGPHLTKILFQYVPEATTRRQMLEKGDTHYVGNLTPDDVAELRNAPGVRVAVSQNFEIDIIPLNVSKPPLDNLKVRQAIQYAFDYQGFLDSVLLGNGNLPSGPIAPGYPSYNPELPPFKQDMAKAKQLLAESGVSGGTMQMNFVDTLATERQSGVILQDALKELGLDLELVPMPWSTMFAIAGNRDTAMHMSNLLMSTFTADPTFTLNQNYGCTFVGRPYNWSYYCNQQAQALIDEAQRTLDRDASYKKLQEAQKLIVQDAPAIFYANPKAVEALSDKVQNYIWDPVDYYWQVDWYNIYLSE